MVCVWRSKEYKEMWRREKYIPKKNTIKIEDSFLIVIFADGWKEFTSKTFWELNKRGVMSFL